MIADLALDGANPWRSTRAWPEHPSVIVPESETVASRNSSKDLPVHCYSRRTWPVPRARNVTPRPVTPARMNPPIRTFCPAEKRAGGWFPSCEATPDPTCRSRSAKRCGVEPGDSRCSFPEPWSRDADSTQGWEYHRPDLASVYPSNPVARDIHPTSPTRASDFPALRSARLRTRSKPTMRRPWTPIRYVIAITLAVVPPESCSPGLRLRCGIGLSSAFGFGSALGRVGSRWCRRRRGVGSVFCVGIAENTTALVRISKP